MVKKDAKTGDALGTGRRKTSIARVRLKTGSGLIEINKREFEEYFPNLRDQRIVLDVLEAVGKRANVDLRIRVTGGGICSQAGACRMGIARALISWDLETFPTLRDNGYLTRDSRMKERKHYGLRGARRGTQFSKR